MDQTLAIVALIASLLVVVLTAARWPWTPGLGWMVLLALLTAAWCWYAFEYARGTLSPRGNAVWLACVSLTLSGSYLFGRRAWGRHTRPPLWQLTILGLQPALVLFSGLLWPHWWAAAFRSRLDADQTGWAYVVHSIYCVGLILLASGLMLRRLERCSGSLRWLLGGAVGAGAAGLALQLTGAGSMQLAAVVVVVCEVFAYPELTANPMSDVDEQQRDAVTGVLTRGGLDRLVAAAVERASSRGDSLSLIYVDIDDFKAYNDSYGHLFGDAVLRAVADRVSRTAGPTNRVGRFGGDELVVVVPRLEAAAARTLAEQIVAVCNVPLTHDGVTVRPSVSAGVAAYAGGTADDLMDAADKAMYGAKRSGGNRAA